MSGWIWVQNVCKGYQQTTKVGKELNTKNLVDTTIWLNPWLKLISFGYDFFYLAKVLATTNSVLNVFKCTYSIFDYGSKHYEP